MKLLAFSILTYSVPAISNFSCLSPLLWGHSVIHFQKHRTDLITFPSPQEKQIAVDRTSLTGPSAIGTSYHG